jgi:hypothetical protein
MSPSLSPQLLAAALHHHNLGEPPYQLPFRISAAYIQSRTNDGEKMHRISSPPG